MEVSDEDLVSLLYHPEHRVRTAALESLAASFCESSKMLHAIFESWDHYEPQNAFPEFPMISHLPVDRDSADESLLRASAMCRDRKLVDPVCRCAGKLIEAYSIAPPETYEGMIHRFENLRRESKIFFRVDIQSMHRRLQIHELSTADLLASVNASYALETLEIDPELLRFTIDELNERNAANEIWESTFEAIEEDNMQSAAMIDACLQILTRRKVEGIEAKLARLLDHSDTKIADSAVLGLARTRTNDALDALTSVFPSLTSTGQLRAALVLQRMRFRGVGARIRLLRESVHQDQAVMESLKVAELLQFDFDAVEDWLEAVLTISDQSLHRVEQRLHLAIPLASSLQESDRKRFLKLLRSRLIEN